MIDLNPLFERAELSASFFEHQAAAGAAERLERKRAEELIVSIRAYNDARLSALALVAAAEMTGAHVALNDPSTPVGAARAIAFVRLREGVDRLERIAARALTHDTYMMAGLFRVGARAWDAIGETAECVAAVARMFDGAAPNGIDPAEHECFVVIPTPATTPELT